ncbi:hypothetical protein FF80_01785 [Devosia sp. LC5]|uniref:hypothetical protein n=1 Tax=Devosia sp. LC5 TaxID=1502724 RepID=UPI0004E2EB94|nr:hypothetical protein [Devosia sp. LC5]KFC68830.1 hypothetical protein FF80_01785 [Devosia sp. LC5]
MFDFCVQRFIWENGQFTQSGIERVVASSGESAAEAVLECRVVDAGPIHFLAVRVWQYGKAKRTSDVRYFWTA